MPAQFAPVEFVPTTDPPTKVHVRSCPHVRNGGVVRPTSWSQAEAAGFVAGSLVLELCRFCHPAPKPKTREERPDA